MVDKLNRPNLDDAMAVERVKAGCLGVDDDFTHKKSSSGVSYFTERLQPSRIRCLLYGDTAMTLLDDFFNGAEGLWNSIQATADQSQEVVVYAGFSPDVIEAVTVPGIVAVAVIVGAYLIASGLPLR